MARKAYPTFIIHPHLQEHKIFQQLIEDRGGGGGQGEGMGEKREGRGGQFGALTLHNFKIAADPRSRCLVATACPNDGY